jgi:hypothetical protein
MLEPIEQISFDVGFIVESIPHSHFLLFEERVMYGLLQKKIRAPKLPHSPIERMVSGIFFLLLSYPPFSFKRERLKEKKK